MDWRALERFADSLLLGIDSRGGHATGYVARAISGEVRLQRASCDARLFVDDRRPFPKGTRTVLLHTRFATQGDPSFPENNHPVYAGSIYCVHNGHVSNDDELFKESGADRLGRVDSEAIPAIVNHYGWSDAASAMSQVEGAAAVALLEARSGDLILARGYSNPIVVVESSSFVVWASTSYAIEQAWAQTLGTPPARDRYLSLAEGDLIRFGVDGSKRTERFASYAPVWTSSYIWTGSACKVPAKPTKPGKVPGKATTLREQVLRLLGADDDDDDLLAETEAQCDGCGDWFEVNELWEAGHRWRVCAGCETYYGWQDEEVLAADLRARDARADARRAMAEAEADAIAEGGPVYLSGF